MTQVAQHWHVVSTFSMEDAERDISSLQAWELLTQHPQAQLIDVRTPAEWMFVGTPDLHSLGKNVHLLSWRLYPSFAVNPDFVAQFLQLATEHAIAPDTPLLFLCRSGGRSRDAALAITALGYTHCYNIDDGFEGEPDAMGHRGTTSGWKQSGLLWSQK